MAIGVSRSAFFNGSPTYIMCSLALMSQSKFLRQERNGEMRENKIARGSGKERLLNRPDHICTGQHDVSKHPELPKKLSHQIRIPSVDIPRLLRAETNLLIFYETRRSGKTRRTTNFKTPSLSEASLLRVYPDTRLVEG